MSNILWAFYDVIILSLISALNDSIVILCNITVLVLGYSRLLHISKFRIIKYNYLTSGTIDKMIQLDTKTYGIEKTWNKKYQKEVYKKNEDSLFMIKYKHNIVGYINYLNIVDTEYDRLKCVRKAPDSIDLDYIIKFKGNRKSYILLESVNILKEYEKDQSIELISRKIKSLVNSKWRKKVYINGIIMFATSNFEKELCEYMKFNKINDIEDNVSIYELTIDKIKEEYLKK